MKAKEWLLTKSSLSGIAQAGAHLMSVLSGSGAGTIINDGYIIELSGNHDVLYDSNELTVTVGGFLTVDVVSPFLVELESTSDIPVG